MLELNQIHKSYQGKPLLKGISFQAKAHETVCLLGPSGSGKSTLLRIISGLELPDSGQVMWDGQDLAGVPTHRRGFGLMFQDYALFPHRNVAENVAFGLRMQGLPRKEIEMKVKQALEHVNLKDFSQRRVTDLSGGEQQRVALARALAPQPRLIMLDEPLGALDRSLREQLSLELREILLETGIPAIYVTHDQEEAFSIADHLIVLHDGVIPQEGKPEAIYASPATEWVASFFGMGSLLTGEVISLAPLRIRTGSGLFETNCKHHSHNIGEKITLLFRPTSIELCQEKTNGEQINQLTGVVRDSAFNGKEFRINLEISNRSKVYFYLPLAFPIDQKVTICLRPEALLCLGKSNQDS